MVRDVFRVSGFLVMDAPGQVVQIVLNQAAPLAPPLVDSLRELLAPAHIVVQLGHMEVHAPLAASCRSLAQNLGI